MAVLNKVVQELTPNTWTKGTMVKKTDYGCQRCLLGWVTYAVTNKDKDGEEVENTKAARVVAETIKRMYPDRVNPSTENRGSVMVSFNDHADTTFQDVKRVVEKAAWREPILWE